MKAVLRRTRISPKKANLVAGLVRGKTVKDSLDILKFTPKKGAKTLYQLIQSAASNAKNNFDQSLDELMVTKILVTKGPTYKRSLPISRGRAHPIRKRTSHITVEVGVAEPSAKTGKVEAKKEKAKPVEKEEVNKAEEKAKAPAKKTTKKATVKATKSTKVSKTAKKPGAKKPKK